MVPGRCGWISVNIVPEVVQCGLVEICRVLRNEGEVFSFLQAQENAVRFGLYIIGNLSFDVEFRLSAVPLRLRSPYDCLNINLGVISLVPICKLRKHKHVEKHFT